LSCTRKQVDLRKPNNRFHFPFYQGLAARRIQRTWKHFYEELEERKDVRDELPAPLVQVIEEKAKLETTGKDTK